MNISD